MESRRSKAWPFASRSGPRAVGLALLLASAAAAAGCEGRPSHAAACADPALRPAFLQRVLHSAVLPPYVSGVEYLDEEAFRRRYPGAGAIDPLPAMVTIPEPQPKAPPVAGGLASRVIVLPGAFDARVVQGELVFRLALLAHELHHARLNHRGYAEAGLSAPVLAALPPADGRRLFDTVSELDAYRHEIQTSRRYRGLPPAYFQMAAGAYLQYYLRLLDGSLRLPPAVRDELLRTRFEPWMLKQPVLVRDDRGWRFDLDGKLYELPPAVVAALRATAPAATR